MAVGAELYQAAGAPPGKPATGATHMHDAISSSEGTSAKDQNTPTL